MVEPHMAAKAAFVGRLDRAFGVTRCPADLAKAVGLAEPNFLECDDPFAVMDDHEPRVEQLRRFYSGQS